MENDPLYNLKHIGYCRVFDASDTPGIEDLVRIAKFYLCKQTNTLWNDPVWQHYLDEEIIVEYFAYVFATKPEAKREFERALGSGDYEDIFKWLNQKVDENQKELSNLPEHTQASITFDPTKIKAD